MGVSNLYFHVCMFLFCFMHLTMFFLNDFYNFLLFTQGVRCSSVVSMSAYGAIGHQIDRSW